MKFSRISLATLLMGLFICQSAFAAKGPREFLESIDQKIQPLLENADANNSRILKLVNRMIDFDVLCRESLGKHWDTRTAEQKEDFSKTLKALIEQNIIRRLKDTGDNEITYQSENIKGSSATVVTLVRDGEGPRASEVEIAYKMEKKGNKWTVVDMDTDGISLVSNYRSQFNKIITEDGWDVLMQKMKDKLE